MKEQAIALELYVGTKEYTVEDAPVGLLMLENGTIICKSEYHKDDHTPECIIVSSGEMYANGSEKKCISLQLS